MILGAIFKSVTKSPEQKKKETYAKSFYGSMASRDSSSGTYKSYKTPFQQTKDDILMDLGQKPKDPDYYARLPERKKRSRSGHQKLDYGNDDSPSRAAPRPRQPTAAELKAQRKAAELAERKRLGQVARKKFEKEKGERVAALRKKIATLLNLS